MLDKLICNDKILSLSNPVIMGILNIGSESFFDGGLYNNVTLAMDRAKQMVEDGALIIDIGAESTKPNASKLSLDTELEILQNIVPSLVKEFENTNIVISIDTYKYQTMQKMLDIGVDMINDIYGFRHENSQKIVSQYNCAVCTMHMQNEPYNMQVNPQYENPIQEIKKFLYNSAKSLISNGVDSNRVVIDPGFGFGKNLEHNIEILKNFNEFNTLGYATLSGLSRKSFLGLITNNTIENRLIDSVTGALISVQKGANIVRVHDVKSTNDALKIYNRIK